MDNQLTKKDVEKMVQDGINSYMNQKQYNYSKIPQHTHNGVDTVQISQANIINNSKKTTFLTTTLVSGGTEIDTLANISNVSRIDFMGFIANNAGGGAATKRAIINSHAEIGQCYFADSTQTYPVGKNIIQACNSMYIDSGTLANNRVSTSNSNFCYSTDETSAVLVNTIISYTNQTITLTTILASGWKLQGALIIT